MRNSKWSETFQIINKYAKNLNRFFPTFIDNSRVYLFRAKPNRGPLAVVWDINNRCNARCIFCNYWKIRLDHSLPQKKELTTKEKIAIVKQLSEAGVWLLSFCSGEPLLSEDLELLIKEAKRQHMLVNISTNGLLLEEKAEMLVNAGVDFITVSVDSHRQELHDEIRGRKGLFDCLRRGIEKIRYLRTNRQPYIEIRHLINKINAFELNEFVDYWGERIDNIVFKPIYKNTTTLFEIPPQMQFQFEEKTQFNNYYHRFLDAHKKLDNLYHRQIPTFFFKKEALRQKYLCLGGIFFGEIDCEGNLYPCQEMDVGLDGRLGNLTKDNFLDIWRSKKIEGFRKLFKSRLRCSCWTERFLFNIYLESFLRPLDKTCTFLQGLMLNRKGRDKLLKIFKRKQ
ncbi:MAG: radical SAM protein [Candidatus Omnitrophica bacterium]|nr:radical SAM protein [Candidatus Omnitrophota bacterium]